jgi:tripeptide aminopeptidase
VSVKSFIVEKLARPWHVDASVKRTSDVFARLEAALPRLRACDETTLRRQVAIASVPAPTGGEGSRANLVRGMLQRVGLHVRQDDAGNVIARIDPRDRASSPRSQDSPAPVAVIAHLDTVFSASDAHMATREGPRVACPGIGDNGRGLAALVTLAEQLQRDDVRGLLGRSVELVATVGEEGEGNLRGARHYFDACGEYCERCGALTARSTRARRAR